MRINHNMMAANASRSLGINTGKQTKSLEKLSSGLSINRAADNAAGLSISEKMRSQIAGLSQASSNAEDGVSYLQTAEGAMNEVSSMLVRMEELTTQRANGTYANDDQNNINLELTELQGEIHTIITTTNFNGKSIDGDLSVCLSDNNDDTSTIGITGYRTASAYADIKTGGTMTINSQSVAITANMTAQEVTAKIATTAGLENAGITATVNSDDSVSLTSLTLFNTGAGPTDAATVHTASISGGGAITNLGSGAVTVAAKDISSTMVKAAIKEINSVRATFGAQQNKLESVVNNLSTTTENLQSAESRIRDTDMASEMANFNKYNILLQASTSMLSQANSAPQTILSLFR